MSDQLPPSLRTSESSRASSSSSSAATVTAGQRPPPGSHATPAYNAHPGGYPPVGYPNLPSGGGYGTAAIQPPSPYHQPPQPPSPYQPPGAAQTMMTSTGAAIASAAAGWPTSGSRGIAASITSPVTADWVAFPSPGAVATPTTSATVTRPNAAHPSGGYASNVTPFGAPSIQTNVVSNLGYDTLKQFAQGHPQGQQPLAGGGAAAGHYSGRGGIALQGHSAATQPSGVLRKAPSRPAPPPPPSAAGLQGVWPSSDSGSGTGKGAALPTVSYQVGDPRHGGVQGPAGVRAADRSQAAAADLSLGADSGSWVLPHATPSALNSNDAAFMSFLREPAFGGPSAGNEPSTAAAGGGRLSLAGNVLPAPQLSGPSSTARAIPSKASSVGSDWSVISTPEPSPSSTSRSPLKTAEAVSPEPFPPAGFPSRAPFTGSVAQPPGSPNVHRKTDTTPGSVMTDVSGDSTLVEQKSRGIAVARRSSAGVAAARGLKICSSAFMGCRTMGDLRYSLQLANMTGRGLSGFLIEFNSNLGGLAPVTQQLPLLQLAPYEVETIEVPCSLKESHVADPSSHIVGSGAALSFTKALYTVEVALYSNELGTVVFPESIPPEVLQ